METTTESIRIIEPTKEAMDDYGHSWGSEIIVMSQEQHQALGAGKMLAMSDGEYTTFLVLGAKENEQ